MNATFHKRYATRLLLALEDIGYQPAEVFQDAGIDLSDLSRPSGVWPQDVHFKMIRVALVQTGRDDLGLIVGKRISLVDHGILGLLVSVSSSLRLAIERALKFIAIVDVLWDWKLDLESSRPHLDLTFDEALSPDLVEYYFDEFLGSFMQIGAELPTKAEWIERIDLPFPGTPARIDKGRRHGIPFHFCEKRMRLHFNPALLGSPLVNSNPEMAKALEKQCEEMLAALANPSTSEIEQIRQIVREALPTVPKASDIARRLHTSERSLRRLCEQSDTSVRDISVGVRMTSAARFIRESDLPLEEISYLVGYASPTAFYRTFKKWHGATPSSLRSSGEGAKDAAAPDY